MEKMIQVLMVEDDPLDVIDIRRTLDKMKLVYQLHHARNGEEAIRVLDHLATELPSGRPDIVLIDINMPKMNGIELLQLLRADERWKGLKCFMITTSDEPTDRSAAQGLGVSGYIVKPFKVNQPSAMDSFNLMIDLMNMRS